MSISWSVVVCSSQCTCVALGPTEVHVQGADQMHVLENIQFALIAGRPQARDSFRQNSENTIGARIVTWKVTAGEEKCQLC